MYLPKKIVVIGPESTGKSTLCKQLAAHFGTIYVEEYAREYLCTNGNIYTLNDLLKIAKGQILLEEKAVQKLISNCQQKHTQPQPIFIDTDMYVMKVWSEFVFQQCSFFILDQIVEREYDLYLLCNIDLPWVKDELREYPELLQRQKLYNYYKDHLVNQSTPWVEISGNHAERLAAAIKAVSLIL